MTQLSLAQLLVARLALVIQRKFAVEDGLYPCISTGYKLGANNIIIIAVKLLSTQLFNIITDEDYLSTRSSMVLV